LTTKSNIADFITHVKQVIFVCYDQENHLLYQKLLR
jgi:O-acetyl-ADP-ribose deacetylase (regulator of RNase III)